MKTPKKSPLSCPVNANHFVKRDFLFNASFYDFCCDCKEDIIHLKSKSFSTRQNPSYLPHFQPNDSFVGFQLYNFHTHSEDYESTNLRAINELEDVLSNLVYKSSSNYYKNNLRNISIKLIVKRNGQYIHLDYCSLEAYFEALQGR
jgi:hypothetical protein